MRGGKMKKLLFVDDQPLTLSFLESTFSNKEKYEIIGSLNQAAFLPIWCRKKKPDLIFMDIQTKEEDTNGLLMAEQIKKEFPHIKIIIMTGFDEISFMPRAKEINADGFIFKSSTSDYFKETLEKVLKGEKVFPDEGPQIDVLMGEASLTAREIEVLRLICDDYSNKEIGSRLFISESTVKHHIASLLRKTGKTGRAGLVAYAMSGGWINPNI